MKKLKKLNYIEFAIMICIIGWLLIVTIPGFLSSQKRAPVYHAKTVIAQSMATMLDDPAIFARIALENGSSNGAYWEVPYLTTEQLQPFFENFRGNPAFKQRFSLEAGPFGNMDQVLQGRVENPQETFLLMYTFINENPDEEMPGRFVDVRGEIAPALLFDPSNGLDSSGIIAARETFNQVESITNSK